MGEVVVMVAADAQGLGREGGQGAREEGGVGWGVHAHVHACKQHGLLRIKRRSRAEHCTGPRPQCQTGRAAQALHMRTPMRLCAG